MAYQSKNQGVEARRLKTQRLVLPFSVVGHATPASKTITRDDPSLLFLNFEGISGITLALGAVDTAGELSDITFASATDSTGVFNVLVRVGETVEKVVLARLCKRGAVEANVCGTDPTMSVGAAGITSAGDKIALNFDCTTDFSVAATSRWALELEYVTAQ
jgi:hypothetical protein